MRVALAVGITACVALAVLWSGSDESSSRGGDGSAPAGGEAPEADDDSSAGTAAVTAAPVRMSADPAVPAAPAEPNSADFAAEPDDPPWAEEKEAQVREVLGGLQEQLGDRVAGAEVRGVDCRSTRCEITVGGSDSAAVIRLVDAIGDERGFYGVAEGVALTRRGDDVVLYVRFRR